MVIQNAVILTFVYLYFCKNLFILLFPSIKSHVFAIKKHDFNVINMPFLMAKWHSNVF